MVTGYTYKGIPIVVTKTRGRPVTGGAKRAMEQGIFPQAKYVEAATIFAATGSCKKVEELCGVPEKIVRSWIKQTKFKEILEEIRDENDELIDAKFTELVDQALTGLKDRLEGGDYILNQRTGELQRKPISARELAQITSVNIDKRQLLRGKPTSRSEVVGEGKRLEQLAEQFIKMTQKKKEIPAIDVDYVQVVEETTDAEIR